MIIRLALGVAVGIVLAGESSALAQGASNPPVDTAPSPAIADSDQVELLLFEGGLALEEGRIQEAVGALAQVVEQDPARLEGHMLYAEALTQGLRGHFFENVRETALLALAHFQWVIQHDPGNNHAENGAGFLMATYLQDAVAPLKTERGRKHWEEGIGARSAGDWKRAAKAFREATRMEPEVAAAHIALGQSLLELNRVDEAERSLERAKELDPENPEILMALARVWESRNQVDQALEVYDSLLARHNHSKDAAKRILSLLEAGPEAERTPREAALLGRAYLELGDVRAAAILEGAVAGDPSVANRRVFGIALFLRGDDAGAVEQLEAVRQDTLPDVEALYYLGAAHLRRGDLEEGRAVLREALALDSRNPNVQKLLGLSLSEDPAQAGEALRLLVNAHSSGAQMDDFSCIVGSLSLRLGRPQEARLAFEDCVADKPDYSGGYYGLGVLADDRGDTREAIEYFEKYLSLEEKPDRSALFRLSVAYLRSGQDTRGFEALRRIVRADSTGARPDSAGLTDLELLEATSFFLASARRFEDAIFIGELLLTRNPENAVYNNNLAMSYADANREPGRAHSLAVKANRLSPANAGYLDTLGWALARLGRLQEAETTLRKSIALAKKESSQNLSEIYYHLGFVCRELSRHDEAKEYLTLALENPPTPFLREEIQRLLDLEVPSDGTR